MYNEDILIIVIICSVIITLIILYSTGYSFKYVKPYPQQEHFFSSIKKWINGGDDSVKPYNSQISEPTTFLPPHNSVNPEIEPVPNTNKVIDTTNILKRLNDTPSDNTLSSNNISTMGLKKSGHVELDNKHKQDAAMNFQFFDSLDTPDDNEFIYTGAEIGLSGANISCGNSRVKSTNAEGIAILDKDGSISDIKMVNKGTGYKTAPKITISNGGGSGCKAKAIIDDNSSIAHIEIIDGGSGYISTPIILIESPNSNKKCRLYIKK
jgi:hypothetical protein